MKQKSLYFIVAISFLFSCSQKTGCPTSGAAVGAEKILAGDKKSIKASNSSKYKGGRRSY